MQCVHQLGGMFQIFKCGCFPLNSSAACYNTTEIHLGWLNNNACVYGVSCAL
jgi:hypothetical protein